MYYLYYNNSNIYLYCQSRKKDICSNIINVFFTIAKKIDLSHNINNEFSRKRGIKYGLRKHFATILKFGSQSSI